MSDIEGIKQILTDDYNQNGITDLVIFYINKLEETRKKLTEKVACDFTINFTTAKELIDTEIFSGIEHIRTEVLK